MTREEALARIPRGRWVTSTDVRVRTQLLNDLYASGRIDRQSTGKPRPQWKYRRAA